MSRNIDQFTRKISLKAIVKKAKTNLQEDANADITTDACCASAIAEAVVIVKEPCVVGGLEEAEAVFRPLQVKKLAREGSKVRKGQVLMHVRGDVKEILKRERTALNYIQILSGIVTNASKLVKKYGKRVAAIRKVHPGLGLSEKRAVAIAGGLTHRLNLADCYLIKDNHIKAIQNELRVSRLKAIGIAIDRAIEHRKTNRKVFVEVEIFSVKEALLASQKNVDAILIDNQKPERVREIVNNVRKVNNAIVIEASGCINKKNIGRFLATGVDFVSMSELTLANNPVDVSLEIK